MNYSLRCVLGRLTSEREDKEKIKRDGWTEQKILVVAADDKRLNWMQREFVNQLGNELYGRHD